MLPMRKLCITSMYYFFSRTFMYPWQTLHKSYLFCHMTLKDLRDMQSIVLKLALASLLDHLLCHNDLPSIHSLEYRQFG